MELKRKNNFILLILIFICFLTYGQDKTNIISSIPKKVPIGKKWIIKKNLPILIEVHEGTLEFGSICNAYLNTTPKLIFAINKGDYYNFESFGIIFNEIEEIEFNNNLIYKITPIGFINENFNFHNIYKINLDSLEINQLVFNQNEKVYVNNCLISIIIPEFEMDIKEIEKINKLKNQEEISKNNHINHLKTNFKIPINSDIKQLDYKDINLTQINFKTNKVFYQLPGERSAIDFESNWELSLNINNFKVVCSNGINKTYNIIDIKYNEQLKMQEFHLGDINSNHTHNLYISWMIT